MKGWVLMKGKLNSIYEALALPYAGNCIFHVTDIELNFQTNSKAAVPNLFGTRDWFRGR